MGATPFVEKRLRQRDRGLPQSGLLGVFGVPPQHRLGCNGLVQEGAFLAVFVGGRHRAGKQALGLVFQAVDAAPPPPRRNHVQLAHEPAQAVPSSSSRLWVFTASVVNQANSNREPCHTVGRIFEGASKVRV